MIWFDLDNSPHVPLFRPVFGELAGTGMQYVVTARNFAQTIDLLKYWNIPHTPMGVHGGKSKIKKVANILNRANQLKKFCKGKDISLAVSHGSRSQLVCAKMMKIPSMLMLDYEYTEAKIFNKLATNLLMPSFIPDERLKSAGFNLEKVIRYNGFKEELYLNTFVPDKDFRKKIGVPDENILVVFRPPGMTGNYHDVRSENLLISALEYVSSVKDAICLIVNRGETEKKYILNKIKPKENIIFLKDAVDGLQLLYSADLAISGGGTMNRESALLGTKTYSIFTGKRPYLDEYLESLGRLKFINAADEIHSIPVEKANGKKIYNFNPGLAKIISGLLIEYSKSRG
ncbi:MAG: DUF354 domain-containing protein [Ignavibacteria bacterium]